MLTIFECNFPYKMSLAAGLNKKGQYIEPFFDLGFGFIEEAKAVIDYLGFNNLVASFSQRGKSNARKR